MCQKRYHFIVRREESGLAMDGYQRSCSRCGNQLSESRSTCKCWSSAITVDDDSEDWVHRQLEDVTHLLHGVVHSNGYAHLLTLNGREGGSKFLYGRDIMDFWDRLCTSLAVRWHSIFISCLILSLGFGFIAHCTQFSEMRSARWIPCQDRPSILHHKNFHLFRESLSDLIDAHLSF